MSEQLQHSPVSPEVASLDVPHGVSQAPARPASPELAEDAVASEPMATVEDRVGETCPEGDYCIWPRLTEVAPPRFEAPLAVPGESADSAESVAPAAAAIAAGVPDVAMASATRNVEPAPAGMFADHYPVAAPEEADATPETPAPSDTPDDGIMDLPAEAVMPNGDEASESLGAATMQAELPAVAEEAAPPASPPPPPPDEPGEPGEPGDDDEEGDEDEHPMTLLDHLTELRNRLIRVFAGVAVGFLLCYPVAQMLFHYLALPLIHVLPGDSRLMFTGLPGGFFVELKVAFVAGIFLACPYVFYQIWAFIAPGLYANERRHIVPLAVCSALFFLGGASFCYFVVFPFAFAFFVSYASDVIVAMPSINEYLSFSLEMLMAFGLIFEMPLFAFFLARMGLITAARMRAVRRYAILGVFIVAAILTPPDVFSQMLMAVPMLLLYELSILVAVMVGRESARAKAEKTQAEESRA